MGFYLNSLAPADSYKGVTESKYFVDKSLLLAELFSFINQMNRYLCITRPRRFGKTVMANMVGAFFGKSTDCSAVFDTLAISHKMGYKEHLNQYHVIYIDFSKANNEYISYQEYISNIKEILREDLHEAFPDVKFRVHGSVSEDLTRIFNSTCEKFIFIFDEWDSIFHRDFITEADRKSYLEFLATLLKDQAYVSLAYMTGILPIAKYTQSSTLNNFNEYNVVKTERFSEYFGFTESEVDDLYNRYIKITKNPTITRENLAYWYDGYHTLGGEHMYNPRSVVLSLSNNELASYWTTTGAYAEISNYIKRDVVGVKEEIALMVTGESIKAQVEEYAAASMFLNTKDEIFSAMVVYGFLNYENGTIRIPNKELMDEFAKTIKEEPSLGYVYRLASVSQNILEATLNGDTKTVEEILAYVHNTETPILSYNSEVELAVVVTFAYLAARDTYRIEREDKAGRGYVDFIFYPYDMAADGIILELKINHTSKEAIQQIKDRQYALAFRGRIAERQWHGKRILAVGISYDSKTGKHDCKIEELPVEGWNESL